MAVFSSINVILPAELDLVGERVLGDRSARAPLDEVSLVEDIGELFGPLQATGGFGVIGVFSNGGIETCFRAVLGFWAIGMLFKGKKMQAMGCDLRCL